MSSPSDPEMFERMRAALKAEIDRQALEQPYMAFELIDIEPLVCIAIKAAKQ